MRFLRLKNGQSVKGGFWIRGGKRHELSCREQVIEGLLDEAYDAYEPQQTNGLFSIDSCALLAEVRQFVSFAGKVLYRELLLVDNLGETCGVISAISNRSRGIRTGYIVVVGAERPYVGDFCVSDDHGTGSLLLNSSRVVFNANFSRASKSKRKGFVRADRGANSKNMVLELEYPTVREEFYGVGFKVGLKLEGKTLFEVFPYGKIEMSFEFLKNFINGRAKILERCSDLSDTSSTEREAIQSLIVAGVSFGLMVFQRVRPTNPGSGM